MESSIRIPLQVQKHIYQWAAVAYPHEGCGLLIGRFERNGVKWVHHLIGLTNDLVGQNKTGAPTLPAERQGQGAGKTEFVMSPEEFNRETLKAEKEGFDVVGIIHTHPDHPPRPSQIDSSQPFLAQWSNIIVSVIKGQTQEMKSWFRESDDQVFVEEPIYIEE